MKDDSLEIKDENGNVKRYSVLFKFDELDKNQKYIVYTDYSINDEGNYNVYARQYIEKDGNMELRLVEDEEVKDFIKTKLAEIMEEK